MSLAAVNRYMWIFIVNESTRVKIATPNMPTLVKSTPPILCTITPAKTDNRGLIEWAPNAIPIWVDVQLNSAGCKKKSL